MQLHRPAIGLTSELPHADFAVRLCSDNTYSPKLLLGSLVSSVMPNLSSRASFYWINIIIFGFENLLLHKILGSFLTKHSAFETLDLLFTSVIKLPSFYSEYSFPLIAMLHILVSNSTPSWSVSVVLQMINSCKNVSTHITCYSSVSIFHSNNYYWE